VRTLAGARAVSALASTRIILPGGRHVALSDLGEVIDGPAQARSAALLNGEPVIAFGIYRAKGYSDWEVAKTAEAALAKLRSANPDVAITPIDSTIPSIDRDYDAAMATLVEGTILARRARYAHIRGGDPFVHSADILCHAMAWILAEHHQPAGDHPGDWRTCG
jgi:multidrug efflux pump subunit AcrB